MGRPKQTELRDRQLNVSLTATEYESLVRRAQAVGMRPVHFGRSLLIDKTRTVDPKTEHHGNNVVRLYIHQLSRLGNLLNQMMRHLHQTGDPVPADLEPLLNDIRSVIARGAGK
ncbi:plasmid mobilization protein [Bradyrhizobium genosp. A]|uniref:plasmid mobilization protein n=1 Tax=Bradyrhizobium genosp. A TaxID=83626 RepID=UPI003CF4C4B9